MKSPWIDLMSRPRCKTQTTPLPELHGTVFKLPPFQRGECWTPEMQIAFCDAITQGQPIPPILLWEQKDGTNWIIDGQQRLTALGATVLRADGTPNAPTGAYLDAVRGRFGPTPGRWGLTAVRAAAWRSLAIPKPRRGVIEWTWAFAAGMVLSRCSLVTYILNANATVEDAMQAFRAINTPGVPIDPAELERLLSHPPPDEAGQTIIQDPHT